MSTQEIVVTNKRPAVYNDYSNERKAEVVAIYYANEGNLTRTANQVGINSETIRYWINSGKEFVPQKAIALTEKLDNIANQCADLLPGMLPQASVREVVGAMGQSVQLSQLLKGLPTSITADVHAHDLAATLAIALNAGIIDITPE